MHRNMERDAGDPSDPAPLRLPRQARNPLGGGAATGRLGVPGVPAGPDEPRAPGSSSSTSSPSVNYDARMFVGSQSPSDVIRSTGVVQSFHHLLSPGARVAR
ncbi:unnamed protein product [Diplocarpon coronariae]